MATLLSQWLRDEAGLDVEANNFDKVHIPGLLVTCMLTGTVLSETSLLRLNVLVCWSNRSYSCAGLC